MGIPHILLEAGGVYHIYNHAVGSDNLFREEENYHFFMRNFERRMLPVAGILAYCLMPNHFHFALRFKDKQELLAYYKEKADKVRRGLEKKNRDSDDHDLIDALLISDFGALFNSYVQAFNKKYKRRGSLLKESFQRKSLDTDISIIRLICYVHNNPVVHGFVRRREDWKHSSYNAIVSEKKTHVLRDDVMNIFGSYDNFLHLQNIWAMTWASGELRRGLKPRRSLSGFHDYRRGLS